MNKFIFTFINIIAAFFAVIIFTLTTVSFPDGNIVSIINSPIYEKTEDFYTLINKNITDVFSYINYKLSFETNGNLNYDIVIAESIDINGGFRKWTLDNCLTIAKNHGLIIGPDYEVKVSDDKPYPPFDNKKNINFILKTYPSSKRNGISSEEEFIVEVMNSLAMYQKCISTLSNNTNFKYTISFKNKSGIADTIYSNTYMTESEFFTSDAFIYVSQADNLVSSNIDSVNVSFTKGLNALNPHPDREYKFYCAVDTNYPYNDIFKKTREEYNSIKSKCGTLISMSIISLIIFLATLFAALYFIFTSERKVEQSQKFFFTLPTEFHIAFYIISNIILIQSFAFLSSSNILPKGISSVRSYFYIFSVYATTITFFSILSAKHADDSLTPSLLRLNKDLSNDVVKTSFPPILSFALIFLPIIIFIILSFYLIYLYTTINNRLLLIVGIILLISTIGFIVYLFTLYNAFKRTLKAQTDANNMRTSLITNVTHDIKTPLTSIISYTDLITSELKKPSKSFKQNVSHYSKIVNEKSSRLNDLINDLIFDSKVSTGNVKIENEKLDLIPFITQVSAEFKDKLRLNGIKIVFSNDKKNVYINADQKHLYRVFQNLFSNISKYALENSRVYMEVITSKNKVQISMKNIQKEKLEVDTKTLKDRFVRGSLSRNTEGFGLGLSIAENLIKSMGGKLNIKSVRDQFITTISFLLYEE